MTFYKAQNAIIQGHNNRVGYFLPDPLNFAKNTQNIIDYVIIGIKRHSSLLLISSKEQLG